MTGNERGGPTLLLLRGKSEGAPDIANLRRQLADGDQTEFPSSANSATSLSNSAGTARRYDYSTNFASILAACPKM